MSLTTEAPRTAGATGPVEDRGIRSSAPAWASVAAWGGALIQLAIGAGTITGDGAARGAGIVLLVLGAAGLAWGAATLVRGCLIAPRTGVGVALLGILAVVSGLAFDSRVSILSVAAACALLIAVALACARQQRVRADAAPPRLAVLMIAAVVVAGAVTPALGATEAGRLAPDHGTHGIVDPGHHSG